MTLLKKTKIFPIKLHLTANKLGLTLRQRMKLGVAIAVASLVIVLYSISSTLLQNSIQVAETQNTRQAVESVLSIVAQTEQDFRDRFVDWSAWDDTYSFITSGQQNYINSNLTLETLSGMKVNLVLYINNAGKIVYGTGVDPDKKQKIRLSDSIKQQITANSALFGAPGKAEIITGIVMLPSGPMLLTSQPILTSRRTGPMRGTLIFGKYLDTERIQNLANRYYLTVREINAAQLPPDFSAARSSLLEDTSTSDLQSSTRENILVRLLDQKTIAGYTIVNDIYGKPALLIRVDVPREIYRQGVTNLQYLFASLVIVGLAFGAIARLMLDKLLSIQRQRRESEILYRIVVTQASEGIFLLDAKSQRFLETNAAFANLLGYTSKEILQMGLNDIIAKNSDKFNEHIQQIASQHHFTAEQQYRSKEGRFIDVEINANLIRYASRDVLCVVVRDITSRKRTEMSLRQQAKAERIVGAMTQRIRQSLDLDEILNTTVAEVREFLRADRVVVYRCKADLTDEKFPYETGVIVKESVNPIYPSMLGQSIQDREWAESFLLLSKQGKVKAVENIYTANLPTVYRDLLAQFHVKANLIVPIQQGDQFWGLLVAHQCSDRRKWQLLEISLLKQLATQVGIAIQQSELYQQVQRFNLQLELQVEERTAQLQRSLDFEAMLKRITDKVRDSLDESQILQTAVYELAMVLDIDCCDTALYNLEQGTSTILYEYVSSLRSLQGITVKMVDFPDIYPQLLQGQYVHHCEYINHNIRSLRPHIAVLACPIFDDRGVLGDMWLYSQPQQAFNETEIRLIQQVTNQCAIAIRQARLYQATQAQVEELEKLNRLKDDFLSTVSHELRTPMSSIKMATQMLEIVLKQAGVLDSEQNRAARYFKILHEECKREINLINDLLDLSRLDAGAEPLTLSLVDIKSTVFHITELFIERMESQNQELVLDFEDNLPCLTTDLSKLERVLTELINNACKYTPAGEKITISAKVKDEIDYTQHHHTTLLLSVKNSGVDIPPHELAHMFDKFYRIPKNDPWKHGGTGLGLALVQKLVTYLGGSISVESADKEICFIVELPINASNIPEG